MFGNARMQWNTSAVEHLILTLPKCQFQKWCFQFVRFFSEKTHYMGWGFWVEFGGCGLEMAIVKVSWICSIQAVHVNAL